MNSTWIALLPLRWSLAQWDRWTAALYVVCIVFTATGTTVYPLAFGLWPLVFDCTCTCTCTCTSRLLPVPTLHRTCTAQCTTGSIVPGNGTRLHRSHAAITFNTSGLQTKRTKVNPGSQLRALDKSCAGTGVRCTCTLYIHLQSTAHCTHLPSTTYLHVIHLPSTVWYIVHIYHLQPTTNNLQKSTIYLHVIHLPSTVWYIVHIYHLQPTTYNLQPTIFKNLQSTCTSYIYHQRYNTCTCNMYMYITCETQPLLCSSCGNLRHFQILYQQSHSVPLSKRGYDEDGLCGCT